ncbi:MAG: cell envelope integrity protein TolA [Gammaproteobacteria bacterium]|nr:cell envelope integrity protein TolA [Gammaproteobacteria bacterium]
MMALSSKKYFFLSLFFHAIILLAFVFEFDFSAPIAVMENTNKNDVISAVVLGDSPTSKILPQELPAAIPQIKKIPEKKVVAQKPVEKILPNKDAIALQAAEKKKQMEKALTEKMQHQLLAKDLLSDIKTLKEKQKKLKQKQLEAQFQQRLRDQSEKSLRQQLLNEEIKLKGVENRQAQGEVNKYKALIMQAISQQWIIPLQANKKLSTVLMIHLAPGGMVLDVQITKSSGDPALDSSARAAVLKSSPLPVPADPAAFEAFRQFVLKMKPENLIADGLIG